MSGEGRLAPGLPTRGGGDAPAGERVAPPAEGESWSVLRMIRWSGQYLEEKGIRGGRRDAEHLLARALGMGRLELYLQFDRPLSPEELASFKPLLLRRAEREPLQHVLGHTSFRELELTVDGRALIPRPETEELVGAVLEWAEAAPVSEPSALDVGTGSGAIALSLALEGAFGRVVATDPSERALELAAHNRSATGLEGAVELRRGAFYEPVLPGERFDVVVSNPPYVSEMDASTLEPEVREWEPPGALFAGAHGLDVLLPLIRGAPGVLADGGLLALEMAPGQGTALVEAIRGTGLFQEPTIRKDLAGRERILLASRL